jgi:hypothetical protein
MRVVIPGFEEQRGLSNCCGAIDCTHFLLDLPAREASACWFDGDHNYSMIMQAVVDSSGKFLDVTIGWPGSVNDARVLRNSEMYCRARGGEWLSGPTITLAGVKIPQYIVEDAGYPHLAWLVIPYPGDMLPDLRDRFNYFHSSTRIIVEIAFGRLEGIWRILLKRITRPDIKFLPTLIGACTVLHNIMLQKGDEVDPGLVPLPKDLDPPTGPRAASGNRDAMAVRDALAEHLFMHC